MSGIFGASANPLPWPGMLIVFEGTQSLATTKGEDVPTPAGFVQQSKDGPSKSSPCHVGGLSCSNPKKRRLCHSSTGKILGQS